MTTHFLHGGMRMSAKKQPKPAKTKPAKAKKPKKNKKPMNSKLKKFLGVVLALIFTALLTVLIITGYLFRFTSNYINGANKMDIAEYKENQAQTTIIYAYDDNNEAIELTRLHGEQNRVWISIDEIPENLQNAYKDLEDKRFEEHQGVDWIRTFKSVITFGQSGGGSTITQQLIKNLTGENGKTISRKYYEILNALNLEKNTSKQTILEAYLNTVYMSHGCYGVKTAAEKYFGKEVGDLNICECACLAAITKNPSVNDPILHPENNQKRRNLCLRYMLEEGDITQEQYEEAKNYELQFATAKKSNSDNKTEEETVINNYYIDYVIECVIRDLVSRNGYSRQQASKMIYNGGLRIYSAVDQHIQSELENVYVNKISMPSYNKNVPDAQSAMTIMDYSGRVLGIIGGTGPKTENRGLNRATSARQPGSAIKPITVYAPAINEKKITYSTKVQNYGFKYNGKLWPHNYGGDPGSPGSYITVQRAVAVSYNTVPAQLVRQLGINTSYKYATEKFHLSTLVEKDKAYAPLAVGGTTRGVTTVDMAAAFACFGNGGKYYAPYCYYKVTNANGTKIILSNENEAYEQAISTDSADIMNKLLQTVITDAAHMSTGRKYGIKGFQTFAKTGTTTDDKDRWFVGGTPYYVAAVWYGCDMPKTLSRFVQDNPSGKIFDEVMTRIHKGLASKEFTVYSPLVTSARYCVASGKLASSGCGDTMLGWYSKNNMPGRCTGHAIAEAGEGETITNKQSGGTTKKNEENTTSNSSSPTTPAPTTPAPTTPAPAPTTPAPAPAPEG